MPTASSLAPRQSAPIAPYYGANVALSGAGAACRRADKAVFRHHPDRHGGTATAMLTVEAGISATAALVATGPDARGRLVPGPGWSPFDRAALDHAIPARFAVQVR